MPEQKLPNASNPNVGHEEKDVNFRAIIWFLVGLTAVGILVHTVLWFQFTYYADREARQDAPALPVADPNRLPPEPRLQASPPEDMRQMIASEKGLLTSYHYDSKTGNVRIPIDRAMQLLAQRGLPTRTQPAP